MNNVSNFFDKYAHDFNAIYGNGNGLFNSLINKIFRKSMVVRYQQTLAKCTPIIGKSVLDIGSGPGHFSVELAKAGASEVIGLDFADGMLKVAQNRAKEAGVDGVCVFRKGDFIKEEFDRKFDYTVLMGLMDYMSEPEAVVKKAISITRCRVLFSFPLDGGFLAWQRKMRYKSRCDLYLYTEDQVRGFFHDVDYASLSVERIARDLMVVVDLK